ADKSGIEVKGVWSCGRQDVDGPCIRMRMRTLHVDDTFIFLGFEFGQMGVNGRRFTGMRMHVEKRRVEDRENERRYCDAGRQSLHGCILMCSGFEVNATRAIVATPVPRAEALAQATRISPNGLRAI